MWEYVKGSEADFEGAPDTVTIRAKNIFFAAEAFLEKLETHSNKWDILSNEPLYHGHVGNSENWRTIAERRKVDNLQSRVNDANLGDALKEMFRVPPFPGFDAPFDTVQRPAHYNQSGIECIDAIAASMTPAEFQAYLKGNVQKYLWRYQHKNGVEDCRKAQWYLDRLVKELSK